MLTECSHMLTLFLFLILILLQICGRQTQI